MSRDRSNFSSRKCFNICVFVSFSQYKCLLRKKNCFYLMHIRLMSVFILLKNIDINTVRSDIFFSNFYLFCCCFFPVYFKYLRMTYMLNIDINWDKTQSVCSYFLSQSMDHARASSHLISIVFNARVFERANYYFNQKRAQMLFDRTEWKN